MASTNYHNIMVQSSTNAPPGSVGASTVLPVSGEAASSQPVDNKSQNSAQGLLINYNIIIIMPIKIRTISYVCFAKTNHIIS